MQQPIRASEDPGHIARARHTAARLATAAIAGAVHAAAAQPAPAPEPGHPPHAPGHTTGHATGPLDTPPTRDGSGTAWLPDLSPMQAIHVALGGWQLMVHGNVFAQYIDDRTAGRGDAELGSINWLMVMARHAVAGGALTLRAMSSLEPLTIAGCGYPDLLATGERCDGAPIIDHQHPHDLVMELAAEYRRPISDALAVSLYGGPAGEPALGPVAFPHRPSAFPNPIAPVTHHWLDATHISFGVVTLGVFGRRWKLEASAFNGREPDEDRLDLDLDAVDSVAARLAVLPGERWALQVSAGWLHEAEAARAPTATRRDVTRATASVTYHHPLARGELAAVTLAWGVNVEQGERTHAGLAEAALPLGGNVVFGRAEVVDKDVHDLGLDAVDEVVTVGKLAAGYLRELGTYQRLVPGLGVAALLSVVPAGLAPSYGGRAAPGFVVFVRLRPAAMSATAPHLHRPRS